MADPVQLVEVSPTSVSVPHLRRVRQLYGREPGSVLAVLDSGSPGTQVPGFSGRGFTSVWLRVLRLDLVGTQPYVDGCRRDMVLGRPDSRRGHDTRFPYSP